MAYHHGNLRAALIDTGVELARTDGPQGVVLREVARRTSVSHNAAYRHFANREELLAEIAGRASAHLQQAMERRLATVRTRDPKTRSRQRLREIGRAYVEFALAEPGLFAVAFSAEAHEGEPAAKDPGPGGPPDDASAIQAAPYVLLGQALDDMVAVGVMPASRRPGADVACWSAVHGFAVLHLGGPLRAAPAEEREAALDALLEAVERGLTA